MAHDPEKGWRDRLVGHMPVHVDDPERTVVGAQGASVMLPLRMRPTLHSDLGDKGNTW